MSLAALRKNEKYNQINKAVKRCRHFLSYIRVLINSFMQIESSHEPPYVELYRKVSVNLCKLARMAKRKLWLLSFALPNQTSHQDNIFQ
jgi:hypothetical protein